MLIESDRLLEDEICLSDQFVLTRLCYVVFLRCMLFFTSKFEVSCVFFIICWENVYFCMSKSK